MLGIQCLHQKSNSVRAGALRSQPVGANGLRHLRPQPSQELKIGWDNATIYTKLVRSHDVLNKHINTRPGIRQGFVLGRY